MARGKCSSISGVTSIDEITLIAGASRGIGRAVTLRLARPGSFLYVDFNRNKTADRETLTRIREIGGNVKLCRFTVADHEAVAPGMIEIVYATGTITN